MLAVIEPQSILREQRGTGPSSSASSDFMALMSSIAPGAAEVTGQATQDAGVASVAHAAITGVATAPSGSSTYNMGLAGFNTGGYGGDIGNLPSGSANLGGGYGNSLNSSTGLPTDPFLQQDYLLNKMRETNMQMLTLQAAVQQENRDWTTRSQILKSKHDTEMAQVRNLRVT